MAQLTMSPGSSAAPRDDGLGGALEPKHRVFLSHSGAQKAFVEHLCVELEGCFRFPFFDKRHDSLPIGEKFPNHIFDAIRQCYVGVVILSEEFLTSKWPMMELVAMVEEVEKRKCCSFKIIPVFLHTSTKDFDDPMNHARWQLRWYELALENKDRIVVEKLEAALKYIRSINGLVYDGLDELRFEKVVVDVICEIVPAEIRYEDSHIQGRSRMCKEIRDKIDGLRKDAKSHQVCVMGLYGIGGIGKTSICKALCNEYYTEFRGKVCHAELERVSEEELLREVVKKLSNTNHDRLDRFNQHELKNAFNQGIIKEAVFLALDNMSDTDASIMQAKNYLSARLPLGSIVLVTARAKDSLTRIRPYLSGNNCMEMPELKIEEAMSLFVKSSNFEPRSNDDDQLIAECVKRCWFLKDHNPNRYHYHPLALDVLGRQLGYIDPKEWKGQLDNIDEDIFNQSKENNHPMFSILRKSFDTLVPEDQLLFMDAALFLPYPEWLWLDRHFEWLGMVHGFRRIDDLKIALKRLKRKSLLEQVGDGTKTRRMGMHDLWRAFCVAETKFGKLRRRRWVYEEDKFCSELVKTTPSGSCWENVKRMVFLYCESWSLERVKFAHFPNVTVLKIARLQMEKELVVDFSGLIHLTSLEVTRSNMDKLLVVQGLPRSLVFLRFHSLTAERMPGSYSEEFVNQIECLEELQHLELRCYSGGRLPDIRGMVSLRVAIFRSCDNVVTLTGLSSRLKYLRVLDLTRSGRLRSCPGVEDLDYLEEFTCSGCYKLERFPNLRKLKKLRKLDFKRCRLITEIPGLGDLVALEELDASGCSKLSKLPDMHKLCNLKILKLEGCPLEGVPGINSLISLEVVRSDFRQVVDKPSLRQLPKLQKLHIWGLSSEGLRELHSLVMLHSLCVWYCSGVDELPDLRSLIRLRSLIIKKCDFKDLSGLSNLIALNFLSLEGCNKFEKLPDLQNLRELESVMIKWCAMLRGWDCTLGQVAGSLCLSDDTSDQCDRTGSLKVMNLRELTLRGCGNIADLTGIGGSSQLEKLEIESLPVVELPDLSSFPLLKSLALENCESLRRLTSRDPMNALSELKVVGCRSLATLPDLCKFPGLQVVDLRRCDAITSLSTSGPLPALHHLKISECSGFEELLPDSGMFPALEQLELKMCDGITTLSSSGPFPALRLLILEDCSGLNAVPDLGIIFPALERVEIVRVSGLTALSSSVALTALESFVVRECRGLSQDDLDQLRAVVTPECQLEYVPCFPCDADQEEDEELHGDVGRITWLSRLRGCCGVLEWCGRVD